MCREFVIYLRNVRYVPGMFRNLLSITQAMKNGFEGRGKQNCITLPENIIQYDFHRTIQSEKGILFRTN